MRVLPVIILLTALILPTVAVAEVQTFTATHTYILGDDDSRTMARQKCLAEAKRKILEQVGVYLESKSELISSSQSTTTGSAKSPQTTNEERQQITEQINTLAAGVIRTEVIKEEFGEANGRLQLTLTVKSQVDPDDIQKQLAARQVDASVRDTVAAQQERMKRLEAQLEGLQREMQQAPGQTPAPPTSDRSAAAVQELRKRAVQGNAKAQFYLGMLYDLGRGVPQDYAQARQWYEQAAAQGNAGSQYSLGLLYDEGQGVPQDYAKARQWYEQAAAQGNASAQVNLGVLYNKGHGVPQDYGKARQWYEKSAAQGDTVGQYNLGMLYDNGRGIPQDYVQAYMWYSLAAANLTGQQQKFAAHNREAVERRMTPTQVAEAQKLAIRCQAQQFKGC